MLFGDAKSTGWYPIMGQNMGQTVFRKNATNFFARKTRKSSGNLVVSGTFMVAEAGLEPTTSGLWAAIRAKRRCYSMLFGPFVSAFQENSKVINPCKTTLSTIWYPRMGQNMGQEDFVYAPSIYIQPSGIAQIHHQYVLQMILTSLGHSYILNTHR